MTWGFGVATGDAISAPKFAAGDAQCALKFATGDADSAVETAIDVFTARGSRAVCVL